MRTAVFIILSWSLASCAPDPIKESRKAFFDQESATTRLNVATGLDFGGTFSQQEFLTKMSERKIKVNGGPLNTSYAKCVKERGYDGKYSVNSISLSSIEKDLAGAVDVAFDNKMNFICFEVFQPKL